jgi:hypothetical protein
MKQSKDFLPGVNASVTGTELRPHNLKELAALYCISPKTFRRWMRPFEHEIGKRVGYYYSIPQVRKIFSLLGLPGLLYEEEGLGG